MIQELINIFQIPFMQKALVAGAALGIVLPFLGVFVTLRKMSFFGDGIAHAALLGVALGVVTGVSPFLAALLIGVVFGTLIYFLERKTNISSDALIGVLFSGALALGLILMSFHRGYQPELLSFLFGNILSVSIGDAQMMVIFSILITGVLIWLLRKLTLIALDKETAKLYKIRTEILDLFFYILLSLTIVLGVKLVGIILVSALLIVPPTIVKMFSSSFKGLIVGSIVTGEFFIISGLILSYFLDLPSGAVIILLGTVFFFLAVASQKVFGLGGSR